MPRNDDHASAQVLEATLLVLIILGAAYSVTSLRSAAIDHGRPRAQLERIAQDSMAILSGMEDANGSLLDAYYLEALHCAGDPLPSATACPDRRSANLTLKISSYLPPGAGYAIALDNGVEYEDLYRSVLAPGETVSSSFTYVPAWNLTFLASELSCYEVGMPANLTAVPVRRGALATLSALALDGASGQRATAVPAHAAGHWNASFPAVGASGLGEVHADATGRGGTFPGAVTVPACSLDGLGPSLVAALRTMTFAPAAPVVSIGGEAGFVTDLAPLLEIPGVELVLANVTVYEPVPPRGTEPDTYLPAAVLPLDAEGQATWDVPGSARLGTHPVVLRVALTLPEGGTVEARRVGTLTLSLPDGTVPYDPPYRAVLQVWFSDWR